MSNSIIDAQIELENQTVSFEIFQKACITDGSKWWVSNNSESTLELIKSDYDKWLKGKYIKCPKGIPSN